jgi:hypothetical protein
MRSSLALGLAGVGLVAFTGCPSTTPSECTANSQCGGDVCARDGECLPASSVYAASITWTIHGAAPTDATCTFSPAFELDFLDGFGSDTFGFSPVPCPAGRFSIDLLPTRYTEVEIGYDTGRSLPRTIDPVTHQVAFDLSP